MAASLPPVKRLKLEAKAWSLRLKFWTQERIAEELGVNQSTISRLLAKAERRALKNLRKKVQRAKARQTLQLEHIADESMQAWERSKQPVRKVREKAVPDLDPTPDPSNPIVLSGSSRATKMLVVEQEMTSTESFGNPAFLSEARAALGEVRRIWGVDEATPDDPEPEAMPSDDPEAMRKLELHRLDLLAAALWNKAAAGDIRAVNAMIQVMGLRAKYLGIEPPVAAESSGAIFERYSAALDKAYGDNPLPENPTPEGEASPG